MERPPRSPLRTSSSSTKRYHALHELLSSERAYASDLALIREVHIPLALGTSSRGLTVGALTSCLSGPIHNTPITPASSNSSSRTVSTASDSSSLGPPMSPEDAKIIFGNISDLAILADTITQQLEKALGAVVEGGQGQDAVGSLFLDIVHDLEKPYKQYITRHPSAMQHLTSLPQTPALTAYLNYTQSVASSLSHAWDLSSLLIKPVQRLLKYPLLLSAIIEETPDAHPDKENLRNARIKLEEVARNVNEERRRAEVVKDVLMSKKGGKPTPGVGVAAQVNLSKMKSLRHGGIRALAEAAESNGTATVPGGVGGGGRVAGGTEAVLVEQMQTELKRIDAFAQQFAKNVVDWSKMMSHVMVALRVWTIDFGKVIGLTPEQGFGSEAFDAFLDVVEKQLMPLAVELEGTINERLLKDMAHLLKTMNQPLKLLASMNEQEPYHYHLLTMPVSAKNRPPPSLLAASTNYLALRGQLAAELPTYLRLLHRGFEGFVIRLAEIQTRFWGHVRERWGVLWEMLRVEGELNAGWEETVGVWMTRWGDVDEVMKAIGILKPGRVVSLDGQVKKRRSGDKDHGVTPAALYQQQYQQQQQQQQYQPSPSRASSISKSPKVATVQAMMSTLEPMHTPPPRERRERRRASSPTGRTRGGSDSHSYAEISSISRIGSAGDGASFASSVREGVKRGSSQDSLRKLNKDGKNRASEQPQRDIGAGRYLVDLEDDYIDVGMGSSLPPAIETKGGGRHGMMQRMKSMPLHSHSQSSSQSHIHPYPIPNPPSLNAKSNSDKSSLLTISTSTSTTTTTATFTGSTTTIGMGLARTSRESEPQPKLEGEGGNVRYRAAVEDIYDDYSQYLAMRDQELMREKEVELERGKDKERGRRATTASATPPSTPPKSARPSSSSMSMSNLKRKSRERPTHTRKRSGSVKSLTSFFTSSLTGSSSSQTLPTNSSFVQSSDPPPLPTFRDSWCTKPAKYICQVIHPCTPPSAISYYSFPFFTLREGELLEVLQEVGHPSIHPKLPLWVDDGEDCLLLCRERKEGIEGIGEDGEGEGGNVGWALASFLEPLPLESG